MRGLPAAETIRQDLEELGFDVRLRLVPNDQIYQACGTVKAQINVCLLGFSIGADPASFFEATLQRRRARAGHGQLLATPSLEQSGQSAHQGAITKTGSIYARRLLVESA